MADPVIIKFWRKDRFCTFSYWPKGNKITVDIGTFLAGKGKVQNTQVWLDPFEFLAYLHAEVTGNVTKLFPKFAETGWVSFGGGGGTARVFKVQLAKTKGGEVDMGARLFSCGHYEGETIGKGAIKPIYSKMIQSDFMTLSTFEVAQLYQALSLFIVKGNIGATVLEEAPADAEPDDG